ncbi:hypothetical protein IQ22_00867 [Pseudomonas duriflava]|uniref:Uncharacterized protein n=1 Tax=Pseudomonas duriflava TaxID=459528 RepID=A0A562QN74_9PSED|nr:hypothetical protein [Pseudomonas duriflava]TWI57650.1 hypothetical protein IQ22_00867 [Pseudomonas duriflava]
MMRGHFAKSDLIDAVYVWAVLRLWNPQPQYGQVDALARGLFALWQSYALLHGASYALIPFLVMEIAFDIAQALPLRSSAQTLRPQPGVA